MDGSVSIGKRFNKLTVLSKSISEKRKDGHGTFSKWLCVCDCGKENIVRGNGLVSGTTKSCGCIKKLRQQNNAKYKSSYGGLIRTYRGYNAGAIKRKIEFFLSVEEFKEITQMNCHYCGSVPATKMSTGHKLSLYIYNGIDRIDNNIGYIKENCAPCCKTCNYAKNTKTYREFVEWINNMVLFRVGMVVSNGK